MAFPSEKHLQDTLLVFISLSGGCIYSSRSYYPLAKYFQLNEGELKELRQTGGSKWNSEVLFARLRLVENNYIVKPSDPGTDSTTRGLWKLTEAGKKAARIRSKEFGEAAVAKLRILADKLKTEDDDLLDDFN